MVPQPDGTVLYELLTGHPDRVPHELVFLADLTVALRAWLYGTRVLAGGSGGKAAWPVVVTWRRTIRRNLVNDSPIGVDVDRQGGLVHQPADGLVDQQHAPSLLSNHLRRLGAQHHAGAALVGGELIQGGLELPALVVQGGQLGYGCLGWGPGSRSAAGRGWAWPAGRDRCRGCTRPRAR